MLLVLKQRYFVLGQTVQNDGSEHLIQRLLELNEFTQQFLDAHGIDYNRILCDVQNEEHLE